MEAAWLLELQRILHESTTEAAQEFWPGRGGAVSPHFNYRLEHIRQVERDAYRVWSLEGGDWEIIRAATWVHDMFVPQFYGPQHAIRAARWALEHLAELGFPANRVEAVAQAVALHDRRTMDIPAKLHEARVLWDAEHLSHLGPAGMLNYMFCHSSEDFLSQLVGNPDYPEGTVTLQDFVPALLEQRPQLYRSDLFYFGASRTVAKQRIAVMRAFLDTLEGQLWLQDIEGGYRR